MQADGETGRLTLGSTLGLKGGGMDGRRGREGYLLTEDRVGGRGGDVRSRGVHFDASRGTRWLTLGNALGREE